MKDIALNCTAYDFFIDYGLNDGKNILTKHDYLI